MYSTALADRFRLRPKQGPLQHRSKDLCGRLDDTEGRAMLNIASTLGDHTAQLALEMERVGLAGRYDELVPKYGLTADLSRKAAAEVAALGDPTVVQPQHVQVTRIK